MKELSPRAENELKKIDRLAKDIARHIARLLPTLSLRHPSLFKQHLLAAMRTHLRPYAGRPRDPEIDQAEQLRAQGHTWMQIVLSLNPEAPQWPPARRYEASRRYQSALRRRRQAARRKAQESNGENKSGENVSDFQAPPCPRTVAA